MTTEEKRIRRQESKQARSRGAWFKTASPFLIAKFNSKGSPPKQYYNEKGEKITKKQFKALKHKEYLLNNPKRKKQKKPKYEKYILSKDWRNRRIAFYRKFGRKCAICDSTKKLNVHHKSYKNLGNELDEELVVFCGVCHEEYHLLNGVQSDMICKTNEFIRIKTSEFTGQESHIRNILLNS